MRSTKTGETKKYVVDCLRGGSGVVVGSLWGDVAQGQTQLAIH